MARAAPNYGARIARLFAMSDDVWARHANPWSVWTRVASLPLLLAAIWSHVWFGWTAAAALITLVVVWLGLNPRLFPAPRSTASWAARATFGERVWINRSAVPIPRHHAIMADILSVVGGVGLVVAVYGALTAQLWPTLLGGTLTYAGKLWFCDRMVWLYEDMSDRDPTYRSWRR